MKNLLYIAPHLSTGGAPQYLFKKIQFLNEIFNIYVVEYNDHGHFRVQKDRIISILKNELKTLSDDKSAILDYIKNINPDIIHFVDVNKKKEDRISISMNIQIGCEGDFTPQ